MKRFVLVGLAATTLLTVCNQTAAISATFQPDQAVDVSLKIDPSAISLEATDATQTEKLSIVQPEQVAQNRALFDWSGVWNTSYGEMRIDQEPWNGSARSPGFVGTYNTDNGNLDGYVEYDGLYGVWVETSSAQRCSTQKLGSYYWGRVYFQNTDSNTFKGYWTYCDKFVGPNETQGARSWTGTRKYPVSNSSLSRPQPPVSHSGPSFRGEWQTSEGRMSLAWADHVTVTGTYSQDNGRIIGNSEDRRVLNGYWIENGSARRCNTQKDGSYYWGRVRFNLNSTESEFAGKWSYCNDEPTSSWTGRRI